MEILRNFSNIFWSSKVWLPPNTTWADIAPGSRPGVKHADYRDLIWVLPLALLLIGLRYLVENYLAYPLGKFMGIKSTKPKSAPPNHILEAAYNKSNRINHKTVIGLAKQIDLTERDIERWWRLRRAQDKPTTLVKFCENTWRFLYYKCSCVYGVIALWDKPWFWDVKSCWYGYPHHSIDNDVWWYYLITMAFYLGLTITQFFDNKRKDFWQMLIHHVITVLSLAICWINNSHREGSIVIIAHDSADILLEAGKIAIYAKYQKTCNFLFFAFTVAWIVTRLGFYPRIVYCNLFEAPRIVPLFPIRYLIHFFQILMLVLHIFWTYAILKIAHNSLQPGQVIDDARSSSGEISDSTENDRLLSLSSKKANAEI